MRNQFNLIRLIGLMAFGLGAILFGATGGEVVERLGGHGNLMDKGLLVFFLLGTAYLVVGIGLFLRLSWTKRGATILFGSSIVIWTIFILLEIVPNLYAQDETLFFFSFSLIVYVLLICGLLYLRHEKVLAAYEEDYALGDTRDDILDR